jgi:hypothetical protein
LLPNLSIEESGPKPYAAGQKIPWRLEGNQARARTRSLSLEACVRTSSTENELGLNHLASGGPHANPAKNRQQWLAGEVEPILYS